MKEKEEEKENLMNIMPLYKLTQKKAVEIRAIKKKHPRIFQKEIGRKFNIARKTIYEVLNNLRWTSKIKKCSICGKSPASPNYKRILLCQSHYLSSISQEPYKG